MTERPILFSGPMVRAILEGRKTQTRRVIKPQPANIAGLYYRHCGHALFAGYMPPGERAALPEITSPYGAPGDRLWVRETWAVDAPLDQVRRENEDAFGPPDFGHGPYFRADIVHENTGLTWRPSIHLPRWASRITLEVVNVRVERLQEISEKDAEAEGIADDERQQVFAIAEAMNQREPTPARYWYQTLWDSINAKRGFGWETNPWVWVVEFKRVTP